MQTTVSDSDGHYLFTDLAPGNYFVYIPKPAEQYTASSTPTDTADNGEDNDDNGKQTSFGGPVTSPVVTLYSATEPTTDGDGANGDLTVDFGFFEPASLGDLVWFDLNKDGIQDSIEVGMPGTADERGGGKLW